MVSAGLNLTGNVSLNAEPAIKAAQTLGARLRTLSENSRTSSATLKENASAMRDAATAAKAERDSLANLAIVQARVNKLAKEGAANAALTKARAGAVTSGASDASGIAATKKQIMLGESMEKITNANIIAQQRLNNEELRGAEISGRTGNAAKVAAGRVALTEARAETEAVRQRIAVEQQEGRVALNNARIKESASRSQIAAARLQMQQETAAAAASARAATAQRESLAVTRGALGSLGSTATHVGVLTGALFVGMAANAIIMDRQFANVVRTSDILDSHLSKTGQNKAIASLKLQFDGLAQSLPLSYKELTEIGAAANQLGVSSGNLASFTKTVAQFSATTGVSIDTASTAFGRLDSLITNVTRHGQQMGGVNHDYQGLADSINKVGVNSVATDQQIINIASQIAGVSNAAGLGYKDIIGFSGALASVGVSPYLARGMTTRLFTNIGNAVSEGGDQLQKFAAVSGLSADQFSKAWKNDPQKVITDLFDGIRASGGDAVNVLKSLGVTSVLDEPAMLKLANAADKFGNTADNAARKGGILRQTFADANTAAGENAKQYAVIADTVQSKLTVALNRIQILFRNIGEANLGPLAAIIDTISGSALKLSQNLDKPFTLLGQFKLPFTNGDLIGVGVAMLGIVSAIGLLGGAALKVGSGLIALRQAFIGVRTFMGQASGGMGLWTRSVNEATVANERFAASQRAMASGVSAGAPKFANLGGQTSNYAQKNAISGLTPELQRLNAGLDITRVTTGKLTAETSAFGYAGGRAYQTYTAGVDKLLASNSRVKQSLGQLGTQGTVAYQRLATGIKGAGSSIASSAARIGRSLGSFLGGPLGIAMLATGAIAGLNSLIAYVEHFGTSAGDASVGLAQMTKQTQAFSGIKINAASPFETIFSGPKLQSFVSGTKEFSQGLSLIGKGGLVNDFIANVQSIGPALAGSNVTFQGMTEGLDKINAGFKQLADNGQADQAIKGIQTLFKGMSNEQVSNALSHMSDVTGILTQKLNENGKVAGKNNENVIKLAQSNSVLSSAASKAAQQTDAMTTAFKGNATAATEYLDAIKGASDASVDLNVAWASAAKIKGGDPFQNFIKTAKKDYQDYVNFQSNILIVAKATGASLTDLAKLSPDILAGAVKAGKKGEQQLADAMQLKDAKDALNTSMMTLGNDPKLLTAFTSLSSKAQKAVTDQLKQGASIPDAFRAAGKEGVDAFNKTVADGTQKIDLKISAKLDDKNLKDNLGNLTSDQAKGITVKIFGDAAPAIRTGASAAEIISQIKAQIALDVDGTVAVRKGESTAQTISRLTTILSIYGDDAPAITKGETASQQIGKLQAKIIVDADPTRASQSANDVKDQISKLVSQFAIHGDPAPAQKSGESAAEYINRLHSLLVVDANAALAKTKGMSAADQITALKPIFSILGDAVPAQQKGESAAAYVSRLKAMISILADASPAQKTAARQAAQIAALRTQITIRGENAPAKGAGESAAAYIDRLKAEITVLGDRMPAINAGESAKSYINRLHGRLTVDGNKAPAIGAGESAAHYINRLRGTISVAAATGSANSAIDYAARDRIATIQVQTSMNQNLYALTGHMATGGPVRGPGSGTSDDIPTMLSNGEYVVRASQARRFRTLLDSINYGGIAKFASGGQVTQGSAKYENAATTSHSAAVRYVQNNSVSQMTELSPYDRHLLQTIADNIGINIAPDYIAGATSNVNRTQARRGNG